MESLFPATAGAGQAEAGSGTRPLCREAAIDFTEGAFLWQGGEPVEVTGLEAVKCLIWKALKTERRRWNAYSWGWGCEAWGLIGRAWTADTVKSEAERYAKEAVEAIEWVTAAEQVTAEFDGTTLTLRCRVRTVYGSADVTG